MKQWVQNYTLFVPMLLAGLFQAVSGFVLWLVLPHGQGYQGGRGLDTADSVFIWPRDTWMDLHDWTAVALITLVIIHLLLHWKWILHTTKKSLGMKT